MTCFCWHKLTEVRDNRRSARMLIVRSMALVPFGGCAYDYPVGGPLSNKVQAWFVDAERCRPGRSERQRQRVVGKTHRWVADSKGTGLRIEHMGRRCTPSEAERSAEADRGRLQERCSSKNQEG